MRRSRRQMQPVRSIRNAAQPRRPHGRWSPPSPGGPLVNGRPALELSAYRGGFEVISVSLPWGDEIMTDLDTLDPAAKPDEMVDPAFLAASMLDERAPDIVEALNDVPAE